MTVEDQLRVLGEVRNRIFSQDYPLPPVDTRAIKAEGICEHLMYVINDLDIQMDFKSLVGVTKEIPDLHEELLKYPIMAGRREGYRFPNTQEGKMQRIEALGNVIKKLNAKMELCS